MTIPHVPTDPLDNRHLPIRGNRNFCSWSGGKDSALALHTAAQAGNVISYLLTVMTEDGKRSRSHGLSRRVLELQAASLGIPIMMVSASWDTYEMAFLSALRELRAMGVTGGVFGDIDVLEHRAWVERICLAAKLNPILPLWQRDRQSIIDELSVLGFKAVIVAIRAKDLNRAFLGRVLDERTTMAMQSSGVDLCGENGEYHTFVTSAPNFSFPVPLGAVTPKLRDGYWVLSH